MKLEFGFTTELTNTHFAPLAALLAIFQAQKRLEPLRQVRIPMQERRFSHFDKLVQVLLSILTGCQTLSEVNSHLKGERGLASIYGWSHFADQSSLSRSLDALTQKLELTRFSG